MDTIMTIPLRDGNFHAVYNGVPLTTGMYALAIGNNKVDIFMGQNDSVFVEWEMDQTWGGPEIRGTRLAENSRPMEYYYEDRGMMKNKPSLFSSALLEQWKGDMNSIESFKTVDNIRPSDDFIAITKKLATVSYLKALDIEYPNMHAMYYPGDTLKYPASLDPVFNTLSYNDTSLYKYDSYIGLLDSKLRKDEKLKLIDFDSAFLNAVVRTDKDHRLKNRLLYRSLKVMVTSNNDSIRRSHLFNTYIPEEKDPVLAGKLSTLLALQNSLVKGMPAPEIEAISIAGKKMNLADFKGRYILVDVWATWCGPCKTEVPFYERYAEMYSGDKIAFVSLSVDQGRFVINWQYEAQYKSKRVVQLRSENPMEFMNKYGISEIPRFFLVDPEGKIAMISMPRPSDPLFEDYLKQQVPGL
jgi:thiol-disulfide isomerase/thioredoxin